jgi:hypothetical protein
VTNKSMRFIGATSFITATSHRVAPYPHESKGR